jgi:hypothetical protein
MLRRGAFAPRTIPLRQINSRRMRMNVYQPCSRVATMAALAVTTVLVAAPHGRRSTSVRRRSRRTPAAQATIPKASSCVDTYQKNVGRLPIPRRRPPPSKRRPPPARGLANVTNASNAVGHRQDPDRAQRLTNLAKLICSDGDLINRAILTAVAVTGPARDPAPSRRPSRPRTRRSASSRRR